MVLMALASSIRRLLVTTRTTYRQTPLCRGMFWRRGAAGSRLKVLGHANNDTYAMQSESSGVQ